MYPDETRSSRKPRCPRPPRREARASILRTMNRHELRQPSFRVRNPGTELAKPRRPHGSSEQLKRAQRRTSSSSAHIGHGHKSQEPSPSSAPPLSMPSSARRARTTAPCARHPARRLATGSTLAGQVGRLGNIANAIRLALPSFLRFSAPPPLLLLLRSSSGSSAPPLLLGTASAPPLHPCGRGR